MLPCPTRSWAGIAEKRSSIIPVFARRRHGVAPRSVRCARDAIDESLVGLFVDVGEEVRLKDAVQRGEQISTTLMKYPRVFPPMVSSMVNIGEETGAVDSMLQKVADFYER